LINQLSTPDINNISTERGGNIMIPATCCLGKRHAEEIKLRWK